jgi:hypothetical protein
MHTIEVSVYGWKGFLVIDAATEIPLPVKVAPMDEHATQWTRALVTQARANLAGAAHLDKVILDRGFLADTDLTWLDQEEPCSKMFRPTSPASRKSALSISCQHRAHGYVGTSAVITSLIPAVPQSLSSKNGSMSLN